MKNYSKTRYLSLAVVVILITCFFVFDMSRYLTLDYIKTQQHQFSAFYHQNQLYTLLLYLVVYALIAAFSLPGAAVLTLAGGAIFGVTIGTILVSFASVIGATLAFWVSRFMIRKFIEERFENVLPVIESGLQKDGLFYLFSLRLIPVFPFSTINLVMGLTELSASRFFLATQLGMLPGTLIYVNAGAQIASINSISGIVSLPLLISIIFLVLFPVLARKLVAWLRARKYLKSYYRPEKPDYNLIVIGAGAGGMAVATTASEMNAKVALLEKNKMGGDSLNTACIPSKALIRSAKMVNYVKRAREYGFRNATVEFDFADVMERVQQVVKKIEPRNSMERIRKRGIDCIQGEAKLLSPYEVRVNGKSITANTIVLATGARPLIPSIPGLENVKYLTAETVWDLRRLPRRLVVLGGGPSGSELAQCFQRLGSQVIIIERAGRILSREDPEISKYVMKCFRQDGVMILTRHTATRVESDKSKKFLICKSADKEIKIAFDHLLIAMGRKPNIEGMGLDDLKIHMNREHAIETDEFLTTNYPNIYACGDVTGDYQFTHMATHQAKFAAYNALYSPFKKRKVNYSSIPWATYTDPEVARVGLNEIDAKAQGIAYSVNKFGLDALDRAIVDEEDHGLVKVLTVPGKDKILGATIVGANASEIIAEFVTAITHNIGLSKMLETVHIYPTYMEANQKLASRWNQTHQPMRWSRWRLRFHNWRRGAKVNETQTVTQGSKPIAQKLAN